MDLATGLFVHTKTDLALNDLLPMDLTRTYRPLDVYMRPFCRFSAVWDPACSKPWDPRSLVPHVTGFMA